MQHLRFKISGFDDDEHTVTKLKVHSTAISAGRIFLFAVIKFIGG